MPRGVDVFNVKLIIVSAIFGLVSWPLCQLLYGLLITSMARPLVIGLIFAILAIITVIVVLVVSAYMGDLFSSDGISRSSRRRGCDVRYTGWSSPRHFQLPNSYPMLNWINLNTALLSDQQRWRVCILSGSKFNKTIEGKAWPADVTVYFDRINGYSLCRTTAFQRLKIWEFYKLAKGANKWAPNFYVFQGDGRHRVLASQSING